METEEAASSYIHIHRCLGNLASGNDYRCHPTCEPGGYDVGFAMMDLNVHQPFATFEEAKEFALLFQRVLGMVFKYERGEGVSNRTPYDLEALQEIDVFGGRSAYATAEHHLKKLSLKIVGDLRRCHYGWLFRASPTLRYVSYKWPAWEKRTDQLYLVVPPKGKVVQLPKAESISAALEEARADHGLRAVYEINPDYDILTNAGLDDLRAQSVVDGYLTQIEVARSSLQHGSLDPRYVDQARTIIERAYEVAKGKE